MSKRKLIKHLTKKTNYIIVKNPSYGKKLKGIKIYYEGKKPKRLKKNGSIKFGKHILETLKSKFEKFHWIITEQTDSITFEYGIYKVRTSQDLLNLMDKENWNRSRDIKNDIVHNLFSVKFPQFFEKQNVGVYIPGTLSRIIDSKIVRLLSSEDRTAIVNFLPDFISSESVGSVNLLKATTEIKTLKELSQHLEKAISNNQSESWWQNFIKSNILLIQQGYIKSIEKMNIAVGDTKFPDFSLVTHDNYLDILEIKRPNTVLLKKDSSRGNYYWDTELSKGIIQVENYISNVSTHRDVIRNFLRDKHAIDLQVLRPRGIILVGDASKLIDQKEKDDFRLLSHSLKNITIVTYDELLNRLTNYIQVLEGFGSRFSTSHMPKKALVKD